MRQPANWLICIEIETRRPRACLARSCVACCSLSRVLSRVAQSGGGNNKRVCVLHKNGKLKSLPITRGVMQMAAERARAHGPRVLLAAINCTRTRARRVHWPAAMAIAAAVARRCPKQTSVGRQARERIESGTQTAMSCERVEPLARFLRLELDY